MFPSIGNLMASLVIILRFAAELKAIIDPVFSNLVNYMTKVSIIKDSENTKSFNVICFFLRKMKIDVKNGMFFFSVSLSLLISFCLLCMKFFIFSN